MSQSPSKSPRTMGLRRAAPLAGLAAFSLLVAPVAQAAPAQEAPARASLALPQIVECVGSSTITYNPGLKTTPQSVTSQNNSTYSLCRNILGPTVQLGAGSGSGNVTLPNASCSGALNPGSNLVETFDFSDNTHSTVQFTEVTLQPGQANTVATRFGTVVSGRFNGAIAVKVTTYVNTQVTQGCGSPSGLTSISGPTTLTFIKLN
ncbi:MAG: hypothetical protein EOO71_05510 [Myxococcaceae bacterium]|nr:MAG: hypothetical protein EOO71_05510 [Myxococcaceae bacterium]